MDSTLEELVRATAGRHDLDEAVVLRTLRNLGFRDRSIKDLLGERYQPWIYSESASPSASNASDSVSTVGSRRHAASSKGPNSARSGNSARSARSLLNSPLATRSQEVPHDNVNGSGPHRQYGAPNERYVTGARSSGSSSSTSTSPISKVSSISQAGHTPRAAESYIPDAQAPLPTPALSYARDTSAHAYSSASSNDSNDGYAERAYNVSSHARASHRIASDTPEMLPNQVGNEPVEKEREWNDERDMNTFGSAQRTAPQSLEPFHDVEEVLNELEKYIEFARYRNHPRVDTRDAGYDESHGTASKHQRTESQRVRKYRYSSCCCTGSIIPCRVSHSKGRCTLPGADPTDTVPFCVEYLSCRASTSKKSGPSIPGKVSAGVASNVTRSYLMRQPAASACGCGRMQGSGLPSTLRNVRQVDKVRLGQQYRCEWSKHAIGARNDNLTWFTRFALEDSRKI